MSSRVDESALAGSLEWALRRMEEAGFPIGAKVSVQVDPSLGFMGYARKEAEEHIIVVAEWALDSEMLGGLLLHELAHIYHTEKLSPSHQSELVEQVVGEISKLEGLTTTESRLLMDAFSHFQNILVDDAVFEILRSSREIKMVQRFFAGWISERPSGESAVDAALLVRNAFAIASLKRRDLFDDIGDEMSSKNNRFLSLLGSRGKEDYTFFEDFLKGAKTEAEADEFRMMLAKYLERMVDLMRRGKGGWEDIR